MTAGIGHNQPPTPFDEAVSAVDLVWTEASNWLDGATAETQAEADAIGTLLDMARKAKKQADGARKAEAEPFDQGKAEVQARYMPILDRCDLIATAAKKALAPFLAAQERAKREAEEKARAEAEAARKAAQEAFATAASLEEQEAAEAAAEAAKDADIRARVAAKDTGRAKGGARAISLRTTIKPEITDLKALMAWIWLNDRSALAGFAETYAAGAFRAGQTKMDGVRAVEVRSVA